MLVKCPNYHQLWVRFCFVEKEVFTVKRRIELSEAEEARAGDWQEIQWTIFACSAQKH
jgi:hypothetical protein